VLHHKIHIVKHRVIACVSGPLAYGDVPKNESVGPGIDCPIAVIGVPDALGLC
jgi:hypothetical protein